MPSLPDSALPLTIKDKKQIAQSIAPMLPDNESDWRDVLELTAWLKRWEADETVPEGSNT